MQPLNDHQIHRLLTITEQRLTRLSERAESVSGQTALLTAAAIIKRFASLYFKVRF